MPLLHDRYELVRPLGEGGAGQTWLATDTRDGRSVTVKELRTPVNVSNQAMLVRETRLLGQLDHPQIPRFIDAFIEPVRLVPRLHLVLEYIPGVALDQELATRRASQVEARATIEDLLGILAYLHGLAPPVLHRDVKPSNVIRRPDGTLALIDFGLATDAVDRTFLHTMAVGTLGYQAPEQIAGDPVPASDVYSVGVLAFELLTRTAPREVLSGMALRWEGRARHLDARWQRWLACALAPDPAERFVDAAAALTALRAPSQAIGAGGRRSAEAPDEPRLPPRGRQGATAPGSGHMAAGEPRAPRATSANRRSPDVQRGGSDRSYRWILAGIGAIAAVGPILVIALTNEAKPPAAEALPARVPDVEVRPADGKAAPADPAEVPSGSLPSTSAPDEVAAELPTSRSAGPTLPDPALRSALEAELRGANLPAACRAGDGGACTRAALALIDPSLHRDVRAGNHGRAAELFEEGCRLGFGEACERLGRLVAREDPARAAWGLAEACAQDRQGTCADFFATVRALPPTERANLAEPILAAARSACDLLDAQFWSTATQARCAIAVQWTALGLGGEPDPAAAQAILGRACKAGAVELCERRALDAFR